MPARLTPIRVAEREIQKLTEREERLIDDLGAVRADKGRWQRVLDELNANEPEGDEDAE